MGWTTAWRPASAEGKLGSGGPLASRAKIPRSYRLIQGFFRLLMRLFFRRVEVQGLSNIPSDRGGVIVSWHPNGLVDPGLILTQFPGQVIFGARHGLFRWPVLGLILRSVGTVPIYRAADTATGPAEARKAANAGSLSALAEAVARGSFSALFPEGISHDEPHPVELKTGAARLYFQARRSTPPGSPPPVLLPVGLFYDGKDLFRSSALVEFHPPVELPADLDLTPPEDETEAELKDRARRLTERIERTLHEVVYATEDWETHHLMHRSRKLVRAERARRGGARPGRPSIEEKALGFARIRLGYKAWLDQDPALVQTLRERVKRYDQDLRALGLEDHELDGDPRLVSPWLIFLLVLQVLFVFLLLPPVLLLGYLVNGPPALLLMALARRAARLRKDEATIKLLLGALLFPATWVSVGVLGALFYEQLNLAYPMIPKARGAAGAFAALTAALGGAVALRYLRVARETARSVRVRLTRRRQRAAIGALVVERGELCDALVRLGESVSMPGVVREDGRVASRGD